MMVINIVTSVCYNQVFNRSNKGLKVITRNQIITKVVILRVNVNVVNAFSGRDKLYYG